MRRGRVVGLVVGLVAAFVAWTATSFPVAAYDTAMAGDGVVGVALAAVALVGSMRATQGGRVGPR